VADTELSIALRVVTDQLSAGLNSSASEIRAWASGVTSTLKDVADKAENLQHLWTSLFEYEAVKHVAEGLLELASAASEAHDSLEAAAQIAENFGRTLNTAELEKFAEQLADSTGEPLQQLRDSFRQLALVTTSQAQLERAAGIAANFARATHRDLGEAIQIVSRVLTGHVALLSRYGIATKDAAGNTLTVNEAMDMLQRAGEKAGEVFGGSLPGHIQVAADHFQLLKEQIGDVLVPAMIKAVDAVTRVIDAFRSLSPEAIQLITWIGAGVTAFTSLILVLGIADALIPLVTAGFELLVGAIALFASPTVTVVALTVGLIAAMTALGNNIGTLKQVWSDFTNFASDAWREFVDNVLSSGPKLLEFMRAIVEVLNPSTLQKGVDDLAAAMAVSMPKTAKIMTTTLNAAFVDVRNFAYKTYDEINAYIQRLFTTHALPGGKPTIPNATFDEVGSGNKGAQKALNDALTTEREAIQATLDAASQRVERARIELERVVTALDKFKSALPDGKVTTTSQALEEQRLIDAEMAKQRDVAAALLQQKTALEAAAKRELADAAALPAADKERVQHAAELTREAHEHQLAAARVGLEYEKIYAAIAKLVTALRDPMRELAEQAQKLAEAAAQAEADVARRGVQGQQEQLRIQEQYERRLHPAQANSPIADARQADAEAQIALQLARIAQALAIQQDEAVRNNPFASAEQVAEADAKVADANAALVAAVNKVTLAHKDLADAMSRSQFNLTNILDTVAQAFAKLVPGLNVQEKSGGGLSVAFSWQTLLVDVLQKTKEWKDVQSVINQLLKVFGQILDALAPIIDTMLRAFAFLANIVIEIYNTFAKLLGLLGIHLQLLDKINTDFNGIDSSPLISIIHDLPTLNELATGKIAPLTTGAQNVSSTWASPITNAMQNPSLGGGLLGVLEDVLGAVLAIKLAIAAYTAVQAAGGIGGLFGNLFSWIGGIFGGGGGAAAAAGASGAGDGLLGGVLGLGLGTGNIAGAGAGLAQGFANAFDTNAAGVADTFGSAAGTAIAAALGLGTAILGGGGIGGAIAGVLEPGKKDAQVGGIAGGIGGALLGAGVFGGSELLGMMLGAWAGPIGAVVGGLLGTVIGGLFGPQGAGSQPDLHDPNFGNEQVALTGKPFSTQGFGAGKMPAWVQQLTGGQGLLSWIQATLAGGQAASGLDPAQYQKYLNEFGTTGGGKIIYGHNIENEKVAGGQFSGNYQALWDEAVNAAKAIADAFGGIMEPFSTLVSNAVPVINALNTFGNELAAGVSASRSAAASSSSSTHGDTHIDHSLSIGSVGSSADAVALWNAQSEMTARVTRSRAYLIAKVPI
jgi:hypothetical protein